MNLLRCTLQFWIGAALSLAVDVRPAESTLPPAGVEPARHSFPALGASAPRKVSVEWNRFYDHAGLAAILRQLHEAFPSLTRLYSIGQSWQGRDLWCLEVTAREQGDPARKPAMWIDGNIHGNEVQGGEAVAYTAWYLCHQYGRLEFVTDLLDHSVFYLVPTINPDGRDFWLHGPHNSSTSRSGHKPLDNDQDGVADEDDFDDLDGDGHIAQMRIRDPNGRWKAHPDFPENLVIPVRPDEKGDFTLLGLEGIDNDGDGRVNEDGPGGYDGNRDWGWDWQPRVIQPGAREYPFSLPETRAVSSFVLQHPNIAGFQSYHNAGGMILRAPGREGGNMQGSDEQVHVTIAAEGERILPFYRSFVIWKDLYTVWGGEIDWLYSGRGIIGFSNELWRNQNLYKDSRDLNQEDQARFIKQVLMEDGAIKWHRFQHPTYGEIEIGGVKKEFGRTPPSFLIEEECHRNMAFTLYHASQMPRLRIAKVDATKVGPSLHKVRVTIENERLIPTRSAQDVQNHISPPDIVTLAGPGLKVLASGRVTQPYFNQVEPVKLRPERIELATIPGMGVVRVEFIVSGSGLATIAIDSAKGGRAKAEKSLPE